MQLCALAQSLNSWSHSVSIDLLLCISPLLFSLGYGALIALSILNLYFLIPFLLAQHLQFDDVTVLSRIMGQIGQKEEITVTMIQFQFWSRIIITGQAKILSYCLRTLLFGMPNISCSPNTPLMVSIP